MGGTIVAAVNDLGGDDSTKSWRRARAMRTSVLASAVAVYGHWSCRDADQPGTRRQRGVGSIRTTVKNTLSTDGDQRSSSILLQTRDDVDGDGFGSRGERCRVSSRRHAGGDPARTNDH